VNLVITFAQVAHDVTKSISVIEESGVDQFELFSTCVFVSFYLEELHEGFLVARASMREHSLVVELGTDISVKGSGIAFAWGRSWLLIDGTL